MLSPENPFDKSSKAPLEFTVVNWSAWAPGIDSREKWVDFFSQRQDVEPGKKADVTFLPAIQRRRLSALARAVFHVSEKMMRFTHAPCPSVFCSSYGETQRTFGILDDIAHGCDVSPTAFSLSVHNAISGQFSIFFENTQPSVSLAPEDNHYLIGFVDAIAQAKEARGPALLVFYEEQLPELYQPYAESTNYPCALALLIDQTNNDTQEERYSLSFSAAGGFRQHNELRPILELIRFLSQQDGSQLNIGHWSINK